MPFSQAYALLIGVDEHEEPQFNLPMVKKDIEALHHILVHPDYCAYQGKQVKTLLGQEATRGNIFKELNALIKSVKEDTSGHATALLYFSGHGWRDNNEIDPAYYLIPFDANKENIDYQAIRASEIAHKISRLQAQRILIILDCCHAGGMELGEGDILPEAADAANYKASLDAGAGIAVLSSSQGDEESWPRKDGKMSIFTYHLIEALMGKAASSDQKEILVSDIMSHVHRKVPISALEDVGIPQHPHYIVEGNFPVALIRGGKGFSEAEKERLPSPVKATADAPALNITLIKGGVFHGNVEARDGGIIVGGDFIQGKPVDKKE